ncbi:MAG: hypothetical protein NZO16_02880, partial [Deltaproteobacteria bacterium]|nr:hypothetical protein [Deltaproteobacteria bacterium]
KVGFGDLTDTSFLLERGGNIRLINGTGDLRKIFQNPNLGNNQYLKIFDPSEKDVFRRDVFAVAQIAVKLFSGEYCGSSLNLENFRIPPPSWFLSIIPRMLELKFNTLNDVLVEYEKLKSAVTAIQEKKTTSQVKQIKEKSSLLTIGPQINTRVTTDSLRAQVPPIKKISFLIAGLAGAFTVIMVLFFISASVEAPVIHEKKIETREQLSEQTLKNLANSDDPVALQTLISLLKEAKNLDEYKAIHYAILERAIRQGLSISAELVRRWSLNFFDKNQKLPILEVYNIFDASLPSDDLVNLINRISEFDQRAAKLLGVGILLDIKRNETKQAVLSGVFKTETSDLTALVISDVDLLVEFGDLVADFSSVSTERLLNLVKDLYSWGFEDKGIRIVRELRSRDLDYRKKIVLSLFEIPSPTNMKFFLANLLAGELNLELLSNWRDQNLTKLALVASFFTQKREDREKLWGIITQAPSAEKSVAEGVKIVRSKFNDRQIEFIDLIAFIQFNSLYPVVDGVEILKKYSEEIKKDKDLMTLIFNLPNENLVTAAFSVFKNNLSIAQLLLFLSHSSPEIRIEAIEYLTHVKDLGALKIILDHYYREKDPRVKKTYEEKIWVVRERVAR